MYSGCQETKIGWILEWIITSILCCDLCHNYGLQVWRKWSWGSYYLMSRPMSWPPHIKQDLLGGLLSLFTSSPRTSIFWWWTLNQKLPYSGDRHSTKNLDILVTDTELRNPAAQILYTIVYQIDLYGTSELPLVVTICSLNSKITWSPISRLISAYALIQGEFTWPKHTPGLVYTCFHSQDTGA